MSSQTITVGAKAMHFSIPIEETICVVCGSDASEVEASGMDYLYSSCGDTFTHVRCLSCDHLYLNPRPAADAASIIYPPNHASYAGTIARSLIMSRVKKLVVIRRLWGILAKTPRIRVLEIGCGDGQLLVAIRKGFPDAELAGLDFHFHPDCAQDLKSEGVKLIEGLAEDTQLDENSYDLVIMNQVIEHLWDVDKVLALSSRALKPAGLLSIETPDADSYDRAIFRNGLWGNYYYPRHLNLFSMKGLRTVLARNGFHVVKGYNTVAPICWVFTMNSIAGRYPKWTWLRKVFTLTNVVPIALFTLVDLAALAAGLHTANQRIVASKAS